MKTTLLIYILFFCAYQVDAQGSNVSSGAMFEYLLSPGYSARSRSLGGVHSLLLTDDPSALFHAPALLPSSKQQQGAITYEPYLLSMDRYALGYTQPISDSLVVGGVIRSVSRGSINAYDEFGTPLDISIAPFGISLSAVSGYAFSEDFFLGSAIHLAHDHLAPSSDYVSSTVSATALLFDAGLLYRISGAAHLSSGVRHIGFILDDHGEQGSSSLPASLYAGISGAIRNELLSVWYLEGEYYTVGDLHIKTAVELVFPQYLTVRSGMRFTPQDVENLFETISGDRPVRAKYSKKTVDLFSLGAGLAFPINTALITVDMAVTFHTDALDPTTTVTLGFAP
ncbi:hypothetical protein [Chitinivibrio alkaliphilus]|uniref:PorV/PorQ family protein n=1 Tax=Chitinivibrio alkaliphilus ACht1 TaxID=1313304 RepID=U7DDL9_9BACT|nr:hypothetical protein [Chitinivibrio alkaliphilus]ERP38986.1 hypothetical protein CALK_0476 [Chitinivibrio alkaliphilus ACht1]